MNIHRQVLSYRQKCISHLSRKDAEFFISLSTIKDLSLFCMILKFKGMTLKGQFDGNLVITKYLQILMLFSMISEDYRDQDLFERFGLVPFECEEIIKDRRPYQDASALQRSYNHLNRSYPLHRYWDKVGKDSQLILKNIDVKYHPMLMRILEYYTTPIVGTFAISCDRIVAFSFLHELQTVLHLVLKRHFKNKQNLKGEVAEYVTVMKLILDLKNTKQKVAA